MTAEEYERLWRFIELSKETKIEYQTEKAWEMRAANIGPSPMETALRAWQHEAEQIADASRHLP